MASFSCRNEDLHVLSSSSSAFSNSSESSSLTSASLTGNSLDKSQSPRPFSSNQLPFNKPSLYSPSSSLETPSIPPRAPGRVSSTSVIRLLEQEKRLSSGLSLDTSLKHRNQEQFFLDEKNSPVSSSFDSPIHSCIASTQSSFVNVHSESLNSGRQIPLELSRSGSLTNPSLPDIINPITPLYHKNSSKAFKHSSLPLSRTQDRLTTIKNQYNCLNSPDTFQKFPLSSSIIKNLPRWVISTLVIQQGSNLVPEVKFMQPSINFSDTDSRIISYSAIPDKPSFNPLSSCSSKVLPQLKTYSQFHSFRFQPNPSSRIPSSSLDQNSSQKEIFGFVLYTCRSDSSYTGYVSESIVLLSHLNYPQLFNACLQLIYDVSQQNSSTTKSVTASSTWTNDVKYDYPLSSPRSSSRKNQFLASPSSNSPFNISQTQFLNKLLSEKLPVLHSALKNIAQWPDPNPNSTLELGFLGTIINVSIPLHESVPLLGTVDLDTSSVSFHSNGSNFHRIDSISSFSNFESKTSYNNSFSYSTSNVSIVKDSSTDVDKFIPNDAPVISASEPSGTWDSAVNYISDFNDLYLLYEYVLLGKPIVIYANTPHLCSSFISLLIDLIRPIPYGGRVREYVTAKSLGCLNDSIQANIKDFEVGGITGITDPELLNRIRECCSPEVLVFALSPNNDLIAAQKQAVTLAKEIDSLELSPLTVSNVKSNQNPTGLNSNVLGDLLAAFSPITSPYFYYRTFHNDVGILRRQNNVWAGFAHHVLYQIPDYSSTSSVTASTSFPTTDATLNQSSHNSEHKYTNKSSFPSTPSGTANPKNPNPLLSNSTSMFSKIFSRLGLSRKTASNNPKQYSNPGNAVSDSYNSSYRTIPKASRHPHSITPHKNSKAISAPIVTKLEPSSKSHLKSHRDNSVSNQNSYYINSAKSDQVSPETLSEIQSSIKQISKSRMLIPDPKFVEQVVQMSSSGLQIAVPKSIEYISNLAALYDSPSSSDSLLKSLLKSENLPFDSLNTPKSLDVAIRFHFATLTSRFLSPLSCYLDPVSGPFSGLRSMKRKSVFNIVGNLTGFQRKEGVADIGRLEKRSTQRRLLGIGASKNHPAMITSESMYNLSLPVIKGSTHDVLQSMSEADDSEVAVPNKPNNSKKPKAHHTLGNKVVSHDKPVSRKVYRRRSSKALSSVSKANDDGANVSGNTSISNTKRYSLPPMLTLEFAGGEQPNESNFFDNNVSDFFKEFDSFTDIDGNDSSFDSNYQTPISIPATSTTSSHHYSNLLFQNGNDAGLSNMEDIKISGLAYEIPSSDSTISSFTPCTPPQISTLSMASSTRSYSPGSDSLSNPVTPTTPLTPSTPNSSYSSKKGFYAPSPQPNYNTDIAASALLYSLSSHQHRMMSMGDSAYSFESSLANSKKMRPVTLGKEPFTDEIESLNAMNNHSASLTPAAYFGNRKEGRTMSLGLDIHHSNFAHLDDEQKQPQFLHKAPHRCSSLDGFRTVLKSEENKKSKKSIVGRESMFVFDPISGASTSNSNGNTGNGNSGNSSSDFKKQDIYKEFMNNMNFANWLKMNNTDVHN